MSTPPRTLRLHQIAHGRSGDKGNRLNINVIAYEQRHWPVLLAEVTAERVAALFAHRGVTQVTRYELPRLAAIWAAQITQPAAPKPPTVSSPVPFMASA